MCVRTYDFASLVEVENPSKTSFVDVCVCVCVRVALMKIESHQRHLLMCVCVGACVRVCLCLRLSVCGDDSFFADEGREPVDGRV